MKRYPKLVMASVLMFAIFFGVVTIAMSADKLIDLKITQVVEATDRNGNPYTRIIVEEARKVKGVAYDATVAVMAFGDHAAPAAELQVGDQLKAIVSSRVWQGRTSYTIQAFQKSE